MEVCYIRFHGNQSSASRSHTCMRTDMTKLVLVFFTFTWPCIVTNFFLIKPTDALISQIYFCPRNYVSGSSSAYHQEFSTVHSALVSFQARPTWSCLKAVIRPAWHIPVPNIQWKTPDDRRRNWTKHVEFYITLDIPNKQKMVWADRFLHAQTKSEIHHYDPKN